MLNFDWDPVYLARIFSEDFYDMSGHWNKDGVSDLELVEFGENHEKYSPIVEDISLDDDILCQELACVESE